MILQEGMASLLPLVPAASSIAGGPATHPMPTTLMSTPLDWMYSIMSRMVCTQYCVPAVALTKRRISLSGSS